MAKETETDILTDALKVVGAEERQEGMPTPSEMEALEDGSGAADETAEAAETEAKEKPKPLDGIDVDLLEEKVTKGEELTEAEQNALDIISEKVEEPEKPEKTYTIAGKNYTFEEMESKFRSETDNEETAFQPSGLEKAVDAFAKSQNREAAHVATSEKQKALAQESRQIAAERQQVEIEKARIETQQLAIERDRSRIEKLKEKLTAKAGSTVTEADTQNPETGLTDVKKLHEYEAKLQAQEQLAEIAEEEQRISSEEAHINAKLAYATLKSVQLAHPQYRTTDDLLVIAKKITQNQQISAEDKAKFLALRSMYAEAATAQLSVDDVYESRKLHGQTLPEVAPPTAGTRPGLKKLNQERTLAEQAAAIKRYKERVAKNPRFAESIGGGPRGKETRRPAQLMNEEERSVRADKGDPMAKNWWKTPKH